MRNSSALAVMLTLAAATMAVTAPFSPAQAQGAFPTRPIDLIIPYAPGGGSGITGEVIKKIIANQGCPFTEAELKLKDFGELQKIAVLAKVSVDLADDFTGQAGASRANEGPKVPVMPSTARLPVTAAAK